MNTFCEIMALWPNRAELQRDCGVKYTTAQQWWSRNSIPSKYWMVLIASAEKRGLPGLSLEVFAGIQKGGF
ncbi:hypothetical protein UFOVP1299_57 [uncultured Caudovirales phage]|uniref:Uncharacterized protein n=1 Tax=uncultured Caudovirales phage TaxID=2100421 RepID=A0A6J5RFT7_9CAUD|nr:hypothetical protein UFOVP1299_57 [uncultured Caudovirales phage]